MAFLEEKLGWIRPESGIPHADCWAHAMAENFSIRKRGYPIRTGELAVLVRRKEISREEAKDVLSEDYERYKNVDEGLSWRFYDRISPKKNADRKSKGEAKK